MPMTPDQLEKAVEDDIDLSRGDFRDCTALNNLVLCGAKLRHTDFSNCNLSGCELDNADFSYAILRGANLSMTTITGANFTGADLTGATFEGSDGIESAILINTKGIYDAEEDDRCYRFVGFAGPWGIMILAGCRWYNVAEANEHWGPGGDLEPSPNEDAIERVNRIVNHFTENPP